MNGTGTGTLQFNITGDTTYRPPTPMVKTRRQLLDEFAGQALHAILITEQINPAMNMTEVNNMTNMSYTIALDMMRAKDLMQYSLTNPDGSA